MPPGPARPSAIPRELVSCRPRESRFGRDEIDDAVVSESEERAAAAIEGARRSPGARPYGILIVDDEPAILESLELTLGSDYRVFTATRGEDGLAILEREDVALIISDQVLPGDERRRVPREGDRAQPARDPHAADGLHRHRLARARHQRRPHLPLHPEALGARRGAPQREARARGLRARDRERPARRGALGGQRAAARGEPLAAARGRAPLRVRPDHRLEPGDEPGVRGDAEGGRDGRHRADHRRDRHGQGSRRARHPLRGLAQGPALRRAELRRAARHAARERALRPQARRLHRRARRQEGPVRGRAPRDDLPRRGGRDAPGHAGAPAARAAGRRDPSARLVRDAPGRRAHHRRHQPRSAQGRRERAASARISSTGCAWSRCTCRRCASAAPTSRRSRTTSSISSTARWAAELEGYTNAAMDRLVGSRLERQRARARERDRAHGGAGRRRRPRSRPTCSRSTSAERRPRRPRIR